MLKYYQEDKKNNKERPQFINQEYQTDIHNGESQPFINEEEYEKVANNYSNYIKYTQQNVPNGEYIQETVGQFTEPPPQQLSVQRNTQETVGQIKYPPQQLSVQRNTQQTVGQIKYPPQQLSVQRNTQNSRKKKNTVGSNSNNIFHNHITENQPEEKATLETIHENNYEDLTSLINLSDNLSTSNVYFKTSNNTKFYIFLAVLILLIAIGGVLFYFFVIKRKKENFEKDKRKKNNN